MRLTNPALFRQHCVINGAWVPAHSGATLDVENPATGERLGSVPNAGRDETRDAIAAAAAAFPAWRARTGKERGHCSAPGSTSSCRTRRIWRR